MPDGFQGESVRTTEGVRNAKLRSELPPIPEGCGILPVAENRIAQGPHPELLDRLPEGLASPVSASECFPDAARDALEPRYRRVLARALALASAALIFAATVAASIRENSALFAGMQGARLVVYGILLIQLLFTQFCSRYIEKLSLAPAAVLLFGYAGLCAMELSLLVPTEMLCSALLCAASMYGLAAGWGYVRGTDLARPVAGFAMVLTGAAILILAKLLLHMPPLRWALCFLIVAIFAGVHLQLAQKVRDFYQDFDDDDAAGSKASVAGALLLVVSSMNVYLLAGSFLRRDLEQAGDD